MANISGFVDRINLMENQMILEKLGIDYKFSSTQIDFSPDFSQEFIVWGKKFIDPKEVYEDLEDPSYGMENEVHCTVLYGIRETLPKLTQKIVSSTFLFVAKLGKVSIFETSDKYDVVKLDVISDSLRTLHYRLRKRVPNSNQYPEYRPHLTVGYVLKGEGQKYVGFTGFEGRRFLVKAIQFSSKNGKKYRLELRKK